MSAAEERPKVGRREDDFPERRHHLEGLSDEELKERFWELTDEVVRPLVQLARAHTSPSIERSVLLRMGFSSLEAKEIADRVSEQGLLGKGAGHVVLRAAEARRVDVREAGLAVGRGELGEDLSDLFSERGEE